MANLMLFSGDSNAALAKRVADQLHLELGNMSVGRFSDGEVTVEVHENVRGKDVFLMQSTCAPTNDNLMELLIMADAMHRASAQRVTAVVPYYGYARQDRRPRSARVAISAKVVADMISTVGIDRILTVDLHADQIQGFFNIPVDNIYGTLCTAAEALKEEGAQAVVCYITHPVFSGPAIERISSSHIDRMVVTDTIPLSAAAQKCEKIHQLSLDRLLAESIRRVSNEESISAMFR